MDWPAGETAFVTGAASGIGLGMSRALVAAGARVALCDVDGERLADVAKELTDAGGAVTSVRLDVTDAAGWEAAADRAEEDLGPISILCNNAGANGGGPLDETPLEVWRWVFKLNAEAPFVAVSTFLPRFKRRGGRAHIVNTASMAGLVPIMHAGAYSSSKFANVGFSMVLRQELQGTDIDVSLLCPGSVASRINVTSGEAEAKLLGCDVNSDAVEANGAMLAHGADPDRVGEQVLEAMQKRQFVIVTHREWEPLLNRVHDEVGTAFAEADGRHGPDPTAQLLVEGSNPVAS